MRLEHTRLFVVNDQLEPRFIRGIWSKSNLSLDEGDKSGYQFRKSKTISSNNSGILSVEGLILKLPFYFVENLTKPRNFVVVFMARITSIID